MSQESNYKSGFPSHQVSDEEKSRKEYGLAYFRAMFGSVNKTAQNLNDRKERYIVNRKYAEGLQNPDKYKDLIDTNGDTSYLNLDWSIVPVIPKFVDVMVGGMMNADFKIQCNAIDKLSLTDKDKEMNEMYADMYLNQMGFLNDVKEFTGIPMTPPDKFIPETSEEAELYMSLNYKQAHEIAMEQAIEYVLYSNDFEETRRQIIRDLIILKIGGMKLSFDENYNINVRYVDPASFISSYSKRNDFKSLDYAGEVIQMTLHELKQLAGNQFTDAEYFEIAKLHAGKNGNGKWDWSEDFGRYYTEEYDGISHEYENFYISVFDGEFATTNKKVWEKKKNKFGGTYVNKKKKEPKKNRDGSEHIVKEIQVWYEGKWIIGTDFLFDYRLVENQPRPSVNGAYSSVVPSRFIMFAPDIYDMENKSLVERMIPHADQIQIAHLKIQQIIAKARPKGLAINVRGLQAAAAALQGKGGVSMEPLELQEIYDQTGVYYYTDQDIDDPDNPIMSKPIEELDNGLGRQLQELIAVYNFHLQMIRDVSGVNEARDASSPDRDSLVGIQKLALQASNNATRGVMYAFENIVERGSQILITMIQDKAKYGGGLRGYYNAIGKEGAKIIELGKDIRVAEYGTKIEALPDEEEKAQLNRDIEIALQNGNIDLEDKIMVQNIPNVKLAEQFLIQRRKKRMKAQQEESLKLQEANAQVQQQSVAAKAQADMQTQQAKAQAEIMVLMEEYKLKEQFAQAEHQRDLEKIAAQGNEKQEQIELAMRADMKKTEASEHSPQPRIFPEGSQPSKVAE
jgi:hypothetical protein